MTKHLSLFFLLIVQDIFDFCISKSHQIIEGLHSCRTWHMLTVHWMVFPVHHLEFLSQILASSSLRISLLPAWQADYSTKMWDHMPLLSLIIEMYFLDQNCKNFRHKMYFNCISGNENKEKNRGRNILKIYIHHYSILQFSTFDFSVYSPYFSAFNFCTVRWHTLSGDSFILTHNPLKQTDLCMVNNCLK